jgi:hypothetical protein
MALKQRYFAVAVGIVLFIIQAVDAVPPFWGTIFIDPDIITAADPTTYVGTTYSGQGYRWTYDRRVNDWTYINAYLFNTSFNDGLTAEIQVNPEFGSPAAAIVEAQKYSVAIGRLPTVLRTDVDSVWIHQGTQVFGGGNNSILIHTGQADLYSADGILEETLVHEASHTSLDAAHAASPGWLAAQVADGEFISNYAYLHPTGENIAETFLTYFAVRVQFERISQSIVNTIVNTIPHRLSYFESQSFNMYPYVASPLGDYNDNGTIDAADYVVWRKNFGIGNVLPNDLIGGAVGSQDYNVWRSHFGQPFGSGSRFAANAAVPEPHVGSLAVVAAAAALAIRGRRRSSIRTS